MRVSVLVVEDEPAIQELIAASLAHSGYEVLRADGAEAALLIMQQTLPDLVLLDWGLPGQPGIDLVRRLHSHSRTYRLTGLN